MTTVNRFGQVVPVMPVKYRPLVKVVKTIPYLPALNAATVVGQGSFENRNWRQPPIVTLSKPLTGIHHARKFPIGGYPQHIEFPTQGIRRVKAPPVHHKKILHTNTRKKMPFRRRLFRRRRLTAPRRARRSTRTYKSRYSRLPSLAIPSSKLVRFRQVFNVTSTGTSGAIVVNPIKANSLNDPSGTLNQTLPLSLDQWASMYSKYIVLGSKIKIRASTSAQTGPVTIGLHLTDNSTALTSHAHYRELPRTKVRSLTTTHNYATFGFTYSGKKFWKLSNIKDDSEQEATFSDTPGDPTDIAYYHLFFQDQNATDSATVDAIVELEFICLLTNPINLARSTLA